ncbi:MAG: LemA family protein [Rickettsiales bacterium]|nr:LemA family protein [Rickettsiales bacterium]
MEFWGVIGVIAVLILWFVMLYNRLIALRQNRGNAFADIDVQLKLRTDLIPNLVETVKAYASHEKGVLEAVTQARASVVSAGNLNSRLAAEASLGGAISGLFAVAENYPQLKADANFRQLQSELADIENKVAAARRFFNNATSEYNTSVQQFPAVLVARLFAFSAQEPFYELTDEARAQSENPPKVSFS